MTTSDVVQGCLRAVRGDEIIHETCGGLADTLNGLSCTPDTRFQLASVSKQFTAAAVLLLVDRGIVSPDDPVARWLPDCPFSWESITVHQLLCHSSGLGHWEDYPEIRLNEWRAPADVLAAFQQRAPYFRPGTAFRYSSPGYVVLAHVVERASNQRYTTFLHEALFAPLGLSRTFAGSAQNRSHVAVGHAGEVATESFELDSIGMGAGDVWSTVGDVLRWNDALRTGEILTHTSRLAMFHPHIGCGSDRPRTDYGYGWFLGPLAGQQARHHTGDNSGFKCLNAWLLDTDLRFVLLSNQDHVDRATLENLLEATVTRAAKRG